MPFYHAFMFGIFSSPFFLHVSSLRHSELPVYKTIHVFGLPHDFGAPDIHHSRSLLCSLFFPELGSVFVNVQWLGSPLGVFVLFPPLHGWGISCSELYSQRGNRATNLGADRVCFGHVRAINEYGIRIVAKGVVLPICKFVFGSQVDFHQSHIWKLLCVPLLFWLNCFWSGNGSELA